MDATNEWKKDCEKEGRGYGGSPSCRTEESGDFSFHKPRVADLSLHARLIDDQLQNHQEVAVFPPKMTLPQDLAAGIQEAENFRFI